MGISSSLYGGVDGNEDIYKMSAKTKGYCCLFLNQNFGPNHKRVGAEIDMKSLRDEFRKCNFEIYGETEADRTLDRIPGVLCDIKSSDYSSKIEEICSNSAKLDEHDAFVAIFSSHGYESTITGTDGIDVKIENIMCNFNNKNCPQLFRKPKIFIFLCCRGPNPLTAVKMTGLANFRPDFDSLSPDINAAIYKDILICYSTVKTFKSYRDENTGTHYGQILANNLMKYSRNKDIVYILTKTSLDMSKIEFDDPDNRGDKIKFMCSWRTISWRKLLFFNPF